MFFADTCPIVSDLHQCFYIIHPVYARFNSTILFTIFNGIVHEIG